MKALVKRYWFLAGVAAAIALAGVAPDAGAFLGKLGAKTAAVAAIFFMSGVTMDLKHVRDDMKKWRCHALVQGSSFVAAPAILFLTSGWLPDGPLKYGVYLVAVVPTTISSCVVLTTAAGGRTPCALVNAVGGNLLGIVLSPLLLGALIGRSGALDSGAALRTVTKLCLLVLLPFAAGKCVGPMVSSFAARVKKLQSVLAQILILIIMFCAFSDSLGGLKGAWGEIWKCFLYLAVAHLVFVGLITLAARVAQLADDESAAVVFCGSQKTLAMAIPLALSFFAGSDVPGAVVLLPIIFYHFFQLAFASVLVPYWARRTAAASVS